MILRSAPGMLRAVRKDADGATVVEFALIAPVLLVLILGIFDLGYNIYANSLLEGAVQKAARDSTIQGADGSAASIDAKVEDAVRNIVPGADLDFDRRAYASFTDVNQAEEFTDSNSDGTCNDNEAFVDVNGNSTWDSDRGASGFGGARDAVLYTVTISYDRAFPVAGLIGLPPTVTTTASTVLRNQPYDAQDIQATVGNCT